MNILGKVFGIKKKKKTYSQDSKFKLCIVDETADHMHTILGVTDERACELVHLAVNAYKNHKELVPATQEILDGCTHVNEVVLALKIFEKKVEESNNPLRSIIQAIGNHGE
jgi:hypothetical protein